MTVVNCGFIVSMETPLQRFRALPALADRFLQAVVQAGTIRLSVGFAYEEYLDRLAELTAPFEVGTVTGIVSRAGIELCGHVVLIALTPQQAVRVPEQVLLEKLVAAAQLAAERGCLMVGLAGYTAAGGLGLLAAPKIETGLCSGNALTAFGTVVGCGRALQSRGGSLDDCTVCVVGATGSIGHGIVAFLAKHHGCRLVLCGPNRERLERLSGRLGLQSQRGRVRCETSVRASCEAADVVITGSGGGEPAVDAGWCKEGAVICDIPPRADVIPGTARCRPDLLVFDTVIVDLPGKPRLDFRSSRRHGVRYPAFAEAAILALSGHCDDFALGRVAAADIETISALAARHGFAIGDLCRRDEIVLRASGRPVNADSRSPDIGG